MAFDTVIPDSDMVDGIGSNDHRNQRQAACDRQLKDVYVSRTGVGDKYAATSRIMSHDFRSTRLKQARMVGRKGGQRDTTARKP